MPSASKILKELFDKPFYNSEAAEMQARIKALKEENKALTENIEKLNKINLTLECIAKYRDMAVAHPRLIPYVNEIVEDMIKLYLPADIAATIKPLKEVTNEDS